MNGKRTGGGGGLGTSGSSYASSIISQDIGGTSSAGGGGYGYGGDASSVAGSTSGASSVTTGSLASNNLSQHSLAYSQSDRLRRRGSFGSDMGSVSQYDYKSQDDTTDLDDVKSQYAGTQSGVTVF